MADIQYSDPTRWGVKPALAVGVADRYRPALPEPFEFGGIGPDAPPSVPRMATGDAPAALAPVVQGGAGHIQGTGQISQPPVVWGERGGGSGARLVDPQSLEQGSDRIRTKPVGCFRWRIAFLLQTVSDHRGFTALLRQLTDARAELGVTFSSNSCGGQ